MKALSTVELGDYPLELRLCRIETTQFRRRGEREGVPQQIIWGEEEENIQHKGTAYESQEMNVGKP